MLHRTPRAPSVCRATVATALALSLSFPGVLSGGAVDPEATPQAPVRIGLVSSLFRDLPVKLLNASTQIFQVLMQAQTGLQGDLRTLGDALELGEALAKDQVQLGVFHGVEFACARQQYPQLRPLVIIVNQHPYLRAHLLMRQDCPATQFADLQGKTLALQGGNKEHCRLFVERQCRLCGKEWPRFFAHITTPANAEDALDALVDGVVQAAVVDGVALDCYQRRKPGRFAKLKEVQQSEAFPAAVVAYHAGALDEALLERFRGGMLTANQNLRGQQLMTLWKITGFELIPSDYEQALAAIVKVYPPPEGAGSSPASHQTGKIPPPADVPK